MNLIFGSKKKTQKHELKFRKFEKAQKTWIQFFKVHKKLNPFF